MNLVSDDSITKIMVVKFALFDLIHIEMAKNNICQKEWQIIWIKTPFQSLATGKQALNKAIMHHVPTIYIHICCFYDLFLLQKETG